MEKEKSIFVEFMGDTPLVRILDFLIEKRPFETTKEEIIKETGIARNSLFDVWKKLEKFEVVLKTRSIGKSGLFVLNDGNEIVQDILKLEFAFGKQAMQQASAKALVQI